MSCALRCLGSAGSSTSSVEARRCLSTLPQSSSLSFRTRPSRSKRRCLRCSRSRRRALRRRAIPLRARALLPSRWPMSYAASFSSSRRAPGTSKSNSTCSGRPSYRARWSFAQMPSFLQKLSGTLSRTPSSTRTASVGRSWSAASATTSGLLTTATSRYAFACAILARASLHGPLTDSLNP
eukprot:Amastigsp_a842552_9.p4 type:complete len:181 gc:universal Amastigsp_a842552_9:1274-732(-)